MSPRDEGEGGGNPVTIFHLSAPTTDERTKLALSCSWESIIIDDNYSSEDVVRDTLPIFHFYMPSGEEVSFCGREFKLFRFSWMLSLSLTFLLIIMWYIVRTSPPWCCCGRCCDRSEFLLGEQRIHCTRGKSCATFAFIVIGDNCFFSHCQGPDIHWLCTSIILKKNAAVQNLSH